MHALLLRAVGRALPRRGGGGRARPRPGRARSGAALGEEAARAGPRGEPPGRHGPLLRAPGRPRAPRPARLPGGAGDAARPPRQGARAHGRGPRGGGGPRELVARRVPRRGRAVCGVGGDGGGANLRRPRDLRNPPHPPRGVRGQPPGRPRGHPQRRGLPAGGRRDKSRIRRGGGVPGPPRGPRSDRGARKHLQGRGSRRRRLPAEAGGASGHPRASDFIAHHPPPQGGGVGPRRRGRRRGAGGVHQLPRRAPARGAGGRVAARSAASSRGALPRRQEPSQHCLHPPGQTSGVLQGRARGRAPSLREREADRDLAPRGESPLILQRGGRVVVR
mmetsp:Transcript_44972/g.143201  ORF Transcript_44972/g.143201 Transcript_44972/m.143201 type:complete len:333 (+) Transcript_44972:435-1433(+)